MHVRYDRLPQRMPLLYLHTTIELESAHLWNNHEFHASPVRWAPRVVLALQRGIGSSAMLKPLSAETRTLVLLQDRAPHPQPQLPPEKNLFSWHTWRHYSDYVSISVDFVCCEPAVDS
jgi:hypothetical protein